MSMALSSVAGVQERVVRPAEHRNEILCVQSLRGIAVLIVLVVHVEDMANRMPYFHNVHTWYSERFGYSAPDLFFVISGFIMSYITLGMPFRPKQWAISRFIRIYPMYFLFTFLALLIFLARPDQPVMGSGPHDAWTIVQSFLMLPQKHLPLLFVGWTVQHEVVFYLIVFIVASTMRTALLVPVLTLLSLCALARWALVHRLGVADWSWNVPSLFLWQFLMGALVYRYREEARRLGILGAAAGATICLIGGVVFADSGSMGAEEPVRVLLFGAAYAFTLVAFLNHENLAKSRGTYDPTDRPFIVRLGDASYSMYLVHPFILAIFGHVGRWLDLTCAVAYLWLPVAYGAVIVCGMVLYPNVEKPLLNHCRRLLLKRPAREVAR